MKKLFFLFMLCLAYQMHMHSMDSLPGNLHTLGISLDTLAKLLGKDSEEKPILESTKEEIEEEIPEIATIKEKNPIKLSILREHFGVIQYKTENRGPLDTQDILKKSGYSSLYYAFLIQADKTIKNAQAPSYEEFEQKARNLIIKRRITITFRDFINKKLRTGLISEHAASQIEPQTLKFRFKGVTPIRLQSIYSSILNDIAIDIANHYIKNHYNPTTQTLEENAYDIQGPTLMQYFKTMLESKQEKQRITKYKKLLKEEIKEGTELSEEHVSNILNSMLTDEGLIKQFTGLDKNTNYKITNEEILKKLHEDTLFGGSEGSYSEYGLNMPQGYWLDQDEIIYLANIPSIVSDFGLKKINVTAFNALSLVKEKDIYGERTLNKQHLNQLQFNKLQTCKENKDNDCIAIINAAFDVDNPFAPQTTFHWFTYIFTRNKFISVDPLNVNISNDYDQKNQEFRERINKMIDIITKK